jgi:CubicO group peptidase (beta-lactamase class C family)
MTKQTKRMEIQLMGFLIVGLLCSCSPRNINQDKPIDAAVEQKIQEIVASGGLPSVQIAVITEGQITWSKTYGQNTDTHFVYMNGSVQKVVDATAVLQLYELGLIDLEADINDYLPFEIQHPDYPDIPITTQMLLSHRSGLDAVGDQFPWDTECLFYQYRPDCNSKTQKMSLEEYLIASFSPNGTNFNPNIWINKPGEKYHYSVSAYPLLRYLIEQVTGKSYPEYMRDNIFEPLGMWDSGFSSADFVNQQAIPHTRIEGENIELPIWNGNGYMMRTTAEDMANFMLVHMNNGSYRNFQLLQPETIQSMHAKVSRGKNIFNLNSELTDSGYGLGIIRYQGDWRGHGGSTVGYQSLWQFNPSKQCGFVLFTNINGILGGRDDFQSVWENMAAIRDILLKQMDPLATIEFFPWGFILAWAMIIFLANLTIRKWRSRIDAQ